jgi:hypothetical protein
MAGRGPAPQANHQRERDTRRRQGDAVHLTRDGVVRGPDFPYDVIPEPHPATVEWWETWRAAPQAQLFEATDWQTLRRAARLQDGVMTSLKVSAQAVSELRLIEERLGATVVDRQRAKIHIEAEGPDATVTELRSVSSRASVTARLKGGDKK